MRWQLTGRGNLFSRSNGVDLAEARQLLGSDRSAAQNVDLAVSNSDNRRFDSVRSWSGIDNQWNVAAKFVQNMLGRSGTNASKAICARRGKRFSKRANDFGEDRMRADSNRDRIQTRGDNFRNDFAFR